MTHVTTTCTSTTRESLRKALLRLTQLSRRRLTTVNSLTSSSTPPSRRPSMPPRPLRTSTASASWSRASRISAVPSALTPSSTSGSSQTFAIPSPRRSPTPSSRSVITAMPSEGRWSISYPESNNICFIYKLIIQTIHILFIHLYLLPTI